MSEVTVFLEQPRGRDTLRVTMSDFKGTTYVDVRVWFTDRDGELRPGPKGVSLRPDAIPAVIEALRAAQSALGGAS